MLTKKSYIPSHFKNFVRKWYAWLRSVCADSRLDSRSLQLNESVFVINTGQVIGLIMVGKIHVFNRVSTLGPS